MGKKYTKIYWNGFWNIKFDILQRHFVCPLKGYENICIPLKYERCVKLDAAMKLRLHSDWSASESNVLVFKGTAIFMPNPYQKVQL